MRKTPRPAAKRTKALPPIYVVVDRRGLRWLSSASEDPSKCYEEWAARENRLFSPMKPDVGDRIVRYVPEIRPTARKGKR